MSTFFPHTGTEDQWNAAYYRLEDYLRSLRVVNKVRQSQIILPILRTASERHAQDPTLDPTSLAVQELFAVLDTWFARAALASETLSTTGRVAFLLTDSAEKWPEYFLAEEIPVEYARELRECETLAGPDLEMSSMVPRPLDIPAPDVSLPAAWKSGRLMLVSLAAVCLAIFKR